MKNKKTDNTAMAKGIELIIQLDAKRRECIITYELILSTSAVGQAPYVALVALDKALQLAGKQAKIWNNIRNYIVTGTNKILWQAALANKKTVVVNAGKEETLKFYGSDIRKHLTCNPR